MTFDQFRGRSGVQPQESQCGCEDQVSQPSYHNIDAQMMQSIVAESQNLQGPPTGRCDDRAPACNDSPAPPGGNSECPPSQPAYECTPTGGPTIINNYYFGNTNVYETPQQSTSYADNCAPPAPPENCSAPPVEQCGTPTLPKYPDYFDRPTQDCGPSQHHHCDTTQPVETTEPTQPSKPAKPVEPTQPVDTTQPNQPTQPTQPVETSTPTAPPSGSDAQGYSTSISGSFPANYWSDRYPNGGIPSWDNNYNGTPASSPLDNSGSIKYSQTYDVTPNYYSGANGQPGYYDTETWNKYNSKGTRYGGS